MNEEARRTETIDSMASSMYDEEQSSFNFKNLFTMFILNWPWFLLSMFICICAALIYLRYTTPVYQVSEKMLVKDEQSSRRNHSLANMQDLGFISNSAGIDNEIEILQSTILAREAVKDLKLYVGYQSEGRIKDHLIYKTQPINVDLDPAHLSKMDETRAPIEMEIWKSGNAYKVIGKTYDAENGMAEKNFESSFTSLPATITTDAGVITFTRNQGNVWKNKDRSLKVTIKSPMLVAYSFAARTSVEPSSKMTSIAVITLKDQHPQRAIDYVKQLAVCYNRQANADKNEIALKTGEFINGRLEKINAELGATEGALESYKRSRGVTQLSLDASQTLQQQSAYSTKLSEANSQIQLLDYLREYVDNPANKYQLIPSNVGLTDNSSTHLISQYNAAVLDRNRLLKSASETAPQVMTLTSTLDELIASIRTALMQARRGADINRQGIAAQYSQYQNRVSNTPEQERILNQIGRQQEVKSGLYLMLLQKREENYISLAATADKGKLIDEPQYMGKVSPKSSVILLVALLLGLIIPFIFLYLGQLLRYRIEGHDDVARLTKLPILADIAVASESAKSDAGIVVHENKNDQIDEIFRGMRTNLQFTMKENDKVVLFTSSTSGEGKTFNAANLAVSFAILGKKVILVGLDIRKPALGRLFNIHDTEKGITNLLVKENVSWEQVNAQTVPSGVNKNLDLLFAGPIPPNPTELLARESLKQVIDLLREHYDYIILDTAPVGLVTDTLQIGHVADATIFVVRADYTPKANIGLINQLHDENKLPNMNIILNGVDMSKKKYGYYYGYGKYAKYGRYSSYGAYGYGQYGNYANSHYGNKDDESIKH